METALVKIETSQLEKVVNESGLAIQEGEEIKQSYLPFLNQLAETQSQASKINFENPVAIDETIARELRLKTVKIRTGAETLKDSRKKMHLLKGNLEQAAYNLIAASCKLTEETFFNIEKARELAEKKRKEQLRIERSEKLSPYTENVSLYQLGEMSEGQFNELYSSLRTAHEKKIEAEKKAESDRLAAIEAERVKQEKIRKENIRLKKEAEEKDRLAEIERKKNIQILAEQQDKADKERKELLEKVEKERKEKDRLAAEIKAKELKAENERKAQIAAEKKVARAPDKIKLIELSGTIGRIEMPDVKSQEAKEIIENTKILIQKTVKYLLEKSETL